MKMFSDNLKSVRLVAALLTVIVLSVAISSGCGPASAPTSVITVTVASTPTPVPTATLAPTPTLAATTTPTVPASVEQIARDIVADVGEVSSAHEGDPTQIVLVFEETHVSRMGQIEIAIMLNRLYLRYDLSHIGLEGAMAADGPLDSSWFHPSLAVDQTLSPREEVAVRLLEEGEINSAELMALVYPDVLVHGIEKAEEYPRGLSDAAKRSTNLYLMAIAERSMTPEQIQEAERLLSEVEKAPDAKKPQKAEDFLDYVVGTNAWTKLQYSKLTDKTAMLSVEKLLAILDEIETKAAEVEVDLFEEDKTNFGELKNFYEARQSASATMALNTLMLAEKYPGAPVAMTVGAAHTAKVAELLKAEGASFAIVRPLSLATHDERGHLSSSAYDRKHKLLSVEEEEGSLGWLLDNRWKPRPVLSQIWFRSEAELRYLTTLIARAAHRGERVPFDQTLKSELPALKYVKLDRGSVKMIDGDVIFSVEAQTNDPARPTRRIWVRTRATETPRDKTLEERLLEARERAKEPPMPPKPGPTLVQISRDVIAKFAPDQATIEQVTLGG